MQRSHRHAHRPSGAADGQSRYDRREYAGATGPGSYLYISSYKYGDRQESRRGRDDLRVVPVDGFTIFGHTTCNNVFTGTTGADYQVKPADAEARSQRMVTPTAQDGTQRALRRPPTAP